MEDPSTADERDSRLQTYCLLALTIMAFGVGLWLLRPVLVPFVLALFFVIGLSPLLDLIQQRLQSNRPTAIGITFVLGALLTAGFASLLTQSILSINKNRDLYRDSVGDTIVWSAELLEKVGVRIAERSDDPADAKAEGAEEDAADEELSDGDLATPVKDQAASRRKEIISGARTLASSQTQTLLVWLGGALLDLLISLSVVLIFMFFLLAGASSEARPTTGLWAEIEGKIRGYIVTKTVISFFTGLAFGVVLWLFGVRMAVELGVLAFLLNFVPNVGPVIAAALPIPLVMFLLPDASVLYKGLAIAAGCAVQVISGNVIEPKIMGDSFELHPIVILLSLILWGIIWGPVGVLLAVPMTAAVKILLDKLEPTRPIAALLAGHLEPLEQAIDRESIA